MRALLVPAFVVGLGAVLPGQVVKTILDNGPTHNRYDLVILGDGYTAQQQARFDVDALTAADALFDVGVTRVVVGTAALSDPELVRQLAGSHRVAVGLDARAGEVMVEGWTAGSGHPVLDVAARFADSGVEALVVTDVDRDGMLGGPDLEGLAAVLAGTEMDVVASGGVASLDDLQALSVLDVDGRQLSGVIVGKAIYEGRIDLAEAVRALHGARS